MNSTGNVTAITDNTGNLIERVDYDIFGMPTIWDYKTDPNNPTVVNNSTIGNNYLYHGRRYDPETNLYYYRARYYDPITGRFLSTDPMGYQDSMNLYQAFNMNGVNYVDPMGLWSENYMGIVGTKVHKLFSEWVVWEIFKKFGYKVKANSPFINIFGITDLSKNRPDVIDVKRRKVWELKPITHMNSSKFKEKDEKQLEDYILKANKYDPKVYGTGFAYSQGDPEDIVKYKKGGERIGEIYLDGIKFYVYIYPGSKRSGFIYYYILPEEKYSNDFSKESELLKEIAKWGAVASSIIIALVKAGLILI